jgi:hypothetical protein
VFIDHFLQLVFIERRRRRVVIRVHFELKEGRNKPILVYKRVVIRVHFELNALGT